MNKFKYIAEEKLEFKENFKTPYPELKSKIFFLKYEYYKKTIDI